MHGEEINSRSFEIAMRWIHDQIDSELHHAERGEVDLSVFETALVRDLVSGQTIRSSYGRPIGTHGG